MKTVRGQGTKILTDNLLPLLFGRLCLSIVWRHMNKGHPLNFLQCCSEQEGLVKHDSPFFGAGGFDVIYYLDKFTQVE